MKTLKLFSLIACMILCGLTANAQVKMVQKNPDEADYFIKGNLNIKKNASNEIEYTLTNVSTEGITFTMKDVFEGKETDGEEVVFNFENAKTTYPGGFENNRLNYWRYSEDEQIWIPESEVKQGELPNTINNYINVMLVLDCSHSLGKGYDVVKSSAKEVIDKLYSASPNGNIRIGIIGFSKIGLTDKQTYPITALNSTSREDMKKFINNFENNENNRKGTALYYSLDKSIEMLQNDSKLIDKNFYSGSFIITFTDGLDQQSQNFEKDILTSDKYYKYIKPILQGDATRMKIYNKEITHFIRSLKGNDITSDKLEAKFDNDLKAICDDYDKLRNINELSEAFSHIVDNLIKRSLELQCFVPRAFEGKVGWTFADTIVEKTIVEYKPLPVKKDNKFFLGINAGIGIGTRYDFGAIVEYDYYYDEYISHYSDELYTILPFTIGVDFAYSLTEKIGLGAYTSFGFVNHFNMSFGALSLFNVKNNQAFIAGIGGNFDASYGTLGIDIRLGYKFNNFYIQCEYLRNYLGENRTSYGKIDSTINAFLIHFGYDLNKLF